MKQIFAYESVEDHNRYEEITKQLMNSLTSYEKLLMEKFSLNEKPKGIVWTTKELATTVFSNVPIPAFTNRDLIYISPDLKEWKELFINQLAGRNLPHISEYYQSINFKEILTILGHELTHHIDLFVDDFDDDRDEAIWFEEGMCEFLPRKFMLSDEEFDKITNIEQQLVETFKNQYGNHSLEEFGAMSYEGSLTSIMYDYWRSFLAVKKLVEEAGGNVLKVFERYHEWHQSGRGVTLTEFFNIDL
ncbi:hypothetical protein E3U55_08565 [Filobacillus milosensis]|uniref:Uncharacterized protein n=1 Tax=Filobacillus milosensis TaxID=94137 RepID=A0A4Y8IMB7_9BACI|nr:hypothetical protein [Filobacillus milosensis]TFB21358.1 hypothetical protein E3U55_08565 [Filobacillus milosensis]